MEPRAAPGVDDATPDPSPTHLHEDAMAQQSNQSASFHPTLTSLREQLQGLLPDRTPAVSAPQGAARPGLLQMVMDNAPILMEVASHFMSRGRQAAEAVRPALAPKRRSWGKALVRPVVIALAVAGAGYLISASMRSGTPGSGRR